tara:strand:+ start:1904 stop:2395 length:492 start_codon:yes stop_codon:yes gene_type:complete
MSAHPFKAIAAMSLNRVIGRGKTIPWHLPEDFKWFKETTMGHVLAMGRRTYESIGRPLPGRETVVLTRNPGSVTDVRTLDSLKALGQAEAYRDRTIFICGGAEIYSQALGQCADLYLTRVKREVEGDAFFPEFESIFDSGEILRESEAFDIVHYRRLSQAGSD